MNSRTQSFVLLLFGGALLRLATSDALLRFVRPIARPWILIAGIGIVALGIWGLIATVRESRAADSEAEPGDAEHEVVDAHGHRTAPRAAWLILAPVVAILVIAPPALGSYSASRVPVTVARPDLIHFAPLPPGSPVTESLIDFAARALWDDGHTLTGRRVQLTGFVLNSAHGGFVLSRLVITCCAADARPIDIGIESGATAPRPDTWVTVVGTYSGISPTDSTLPMIDAKSVTLVHQPSNPYDD